jgi:hypothetical protein
MMLPRALLDRRIRSLLIVGAVFTVGLLVNAFYLPRYSAPAIGVVYVAMLQSMRHFRTLTAGPVMLRSLILVCLLSAGLRLAAHPLNIHFAANPALWYGPGALGIPRANVASKLLSLPGKHLAVVQYSPTHFCYDEWVYNDADIDGSRLVWARGIDPASDRKLIEYFKDRHVWLVEPDKDPPAVSPYPQPGQMEARSVE